MTHLNHESCLWKWIQVDSHNLNGLGLTADITIPLAMTLIHQLFTFSMVIFPSTLLVIHLVWQSRQVIKQTQWAAVTTMFLLTSVPPQCVPSPFTLTTHGFEWGLTSHALGPLILPPISFESLVMQCSLSKNKSTWKVWLLKQFEQTFSHFLTGFQTFYLYLIV